MQRNELTFINHACFSVENDSALLLVDPWLEGPAFNNGLGLLDTSTGSEQVIARLNKSGLPVFVWFSHAQPEHVSIPFIKKFRERFRGIATFLLQRTLDQRLAGMLRKQGLAVAECGEGETVALGRDMRLAAFPGGDGRAWCVIRSGGRTILNLHGCALDTPEQCRAAREKLERLSARVDVLFTGFGYTHWVGNPEQPSLHKAAAHAAINRIALQASLFRPRLLVPFATFVLFAHPENRYLNGAQNAPQSVAAAPQLARYGHLLRFLRPGSRVDLDSDSAASLTLEHERALAHWTDLLAREHPLLPAQPGVPVQEIKLAFQAYRAAVAARLHGLPSLLETLRRIVPLAIRLHDVGETVQVSYRRGWRVLDKAAAWDVSMSSASALFLFKNACGYETMQVNGCFRLGSPEAAHRFRRFFVAQRMATSGYGRTHPLVTVRYLLRQLAARAGRRLQAVLRLT